MSIGYIYILSHPAMPGLLKIGYTAREDVEERVRELSATTGVPGPFEIEYYCLTQEVEKVEYTIHEHFKSVRIQGKEFFEVGDEEAVRLVESIVIEVEPDRYYRVALSEAREASGKIRGLRCTACAHAYVIPFESSDRPCPKCGGDTVERISHTMVFLDEKNEEASQSASRMRCRICMNEWAMGGPPSMFRNSLGDEPCPKCKSYETGPVW